MGASGGAVAALERQIALRWSEYAQAYRALGMSRPSAEDIHVLRVAGRRLTVALRILETLAHSRRSRALRQHVRATVHRLGALRDRDVHCTLLQRLARRHATLRPVLVGLRVRQARAMARLSETLPAARLTAQERRLQRLLPAVRENASPQDSALSVALVAWLRGEEARVLRALERAQGGDTRRLHRLRIACKRFRYTLELVLALRLQRGGKSALERAKAWQTALGDVQDWSTLERRLLRHERRQPGALGSQALAAVTGRRAAVASAVLREAPRLKGFVMRTTRLARAPWET